MATIPRRAAEMRGGERDAAAAGDDSNGGDRRPGRLRRSRGPYAEYNPRALKLDNPVEGLDRADRKAIGPGWDPRLTRYLKPEQVRTLYLELPEMSREAPWRPMFAVGTFAGLRPGEVFALEWGDLYFEARTIHVR